MGVTMVFWVSVTQFNQPHLRAPVLELSQFVGSVAHLLLCPPLMVLRDWRASWDVLKATFRLWPPLFRHMEDSIRVHSLKGMRPLLTNWFWRSNTNTLSPVDSAGWEDGGNNSSQALSGPRGDNWLWSWVCDTDSSDRLAPELIRLGFGFSLSLCKK